MTTEEEISGFQNESEEGTVCPACAAFIGPNEVFCPACRAPISLLSNTDPLQRIQAEGYLYGRVVDSRPKPVILIGVWVLCLPWALIAGSFALMILFAGIGSGMAGFIAFWGAVALTIFPAVVLYKVTRNYLKQPERARDEIED
jgi:hypothetical protein